MDLQLILAVNAMAVSAMICGGMVIYRRLAGNVNWLLVNGLVVAVGLFALWLKPDVAGIWVALVFVPFVLVPIVLSWLQPRQMLAGQTDQAARTARWIAVLQPSETARITADLATAIAASSPSDTRAMKELAGRVSPQYRPIVASHEAMIRRDWAEVLAHAETARDAPSIMRPLEVRALGELGRRTDMIRAYTHSKDLLAGTGFALARMVVLAFGGRPNGVQALLATSLAKIPEETKTFWVALAYLNSGTNTAPGQRALTHLAAKAALPVTRTSAQRHLDLAAKRPPESLPPDAVAALDALEERTLGTAHARALSFWAYPLTLGLIGVNLLAFAAEVLLGGSEDSETLITLGALWPPDVLQGGEWWRLVTASFLHFGPIHLATNMLVLWVLGRFLEPALGTLRMLAVYAVGGVASSAFVLWLMAAKHTDYGLLVGASGAIFALLGAEAGMLLTSWLRDRASFDSAKLKTLLMMLGLQVVIDMSLPNVSFAAHASGFVTGLVMMAAWPYVAAVFSRDRTTSGRRS